ncbi:MAG TPA: aminotransferase class I/II-fold pyridoxal phosphate-dependent enzyme [Streptosporangiaceae bacterium]|nr:aminotransferase class I/II-fold pyridoxal phosphate-dependent enzyme [Streptosporangiaceae bacterium]
MASRRALRLAGGSPAIAAAHFQAEERPYDPALDPDGYLNLGTAENRLLWDLLEPRLTCARRLAAADIRYGLLYGTAALREAVAAFLTRTRGAPVAADDLVVVSGATAALDIAATALCDPGEAIIIPSPYYGAFDVDLAGRSEARLVAAPGRRGDQFRPGPQALDRAIGRAWRAGLKPRAVALASPSNPVGQVYGPDVLGEILRVAAAHGLDVIADEIYANSVFGPGSFTPMSALTGPMLPPGQVHTVWGFAKDFGLPGLKVGVLHTTDLAVRAAARELAYFAPVSTDTQALLCSLLADPAWTDDFLAAGRARLGDSYARVAGLLDKHQIGYLPAAAGFSVWIDLGPWLPGPGFEGESALWRRLWDEAHLNILPGAEFHSPEPGWFRVCHATDPAIVTEAIGRLAGLLQEQAS